VLLTFCEIFSSVRIVCKMVHGQAFGDENLHTVSHNLLTTNAKNLTQRMNNNLTTNQVVLYKINQLQQLYNILHIPTYVFVCLSITPQSPAEEENIEALSDQRPHASHTAKDDSGKDDDTHNTHLHVAPHPAAG
jgi:hypothetical protein